jgi:large subunit ribosomal protein L32
MRIRQRRGHKKADIAAVATCPDCGAPRPNHSVCPSCGRYKGHQITAASTEE